MPGVENMAGKCRYNMSRGCLPLCHSANVCVCDIWKICDLVQKSNASTCLCWRVSNPAEGEKEKAKCLLAYQRHNYNTRKPSHTRQKQVFTLFSWVYWSVCLRGGNYLLWECLTTTSNGSTLLFYQQGSGHRPREVMSGFPGLKQKVKILSSDIRSLLDHKQCKQC